MKIQKNTLWWLVAGSSALGLVSSLVQTIERIKFADNPSVPLQCDLNSIFSCSNVFDSWQSSVFGFSNSLICLIFFALTGGLALAAATGSNLNKNLRFIFQFFAVFFLGFGAWYLWQSTFRIGYICIFCLFCYLAVITMNWAWFRLNYADLPLKKSFIKKLTAFVDKGADLFVAILWAVAIGTMIIFRFW